MKIDLVYLWVNGSDEQWLAKKNETLLSLGKTPATSSVSAKRWRDHDELLYSLRSVEMYASWINNIFIVTDGQTPSWLNLDNPKVTIVSHSEIIPSKYLPTFNSNAIEFWLQEIPNLSEHYLYANDDMFFGKPVTPDLFFDENENPIVMFKERNNKKAFAQKNTNGNWKKTKWNALQLIDDKYGLRYNISFKHAVEPVRKSYIKENCKEFYYEIIEPTMTPFRDKKNIQRMIFPMIDNAKKRNIIVLNWRTKNERTTYSISKDTNLKRFGHRIKWILGTILGYVQYDCFDKQWNILHFLKKYCPATFAINDSSGDFAPKAKFLQDSFPSKSKFEK